MKKKCKFAETMDKSPCLNCEHKYENKNTKQCVNCLLRCQYIYEIGNMTHSLPMDKTDLGKKGKIDNLANRQFDPPNNLKYDLKICSTCKKPKPKDEKHFYRNNRYRDGLTGQCIECLRLKHRQYKRKKRYEFWHNFSISK